jgi:hypothetical protein
MAQLRLRTALLLTIVAALTISPMDATAKKKGSDKGAKGGNVNSLLIKRQYGAAIQLLEARANAGDVRAQFGQHLSYWAWRSSEYRSRNHVAW